MICGKCGGAGAVIKRHPGRTGVFQYVDRAELCECTSEEIRLLKNIFLEAFHFGPITLAGSVEDICEAEKRIVKAVNDYGEFTEKYKK